jgi:hypothetical protein
MKQETTMFTHAAKLPRGVLMVAVALSIGIADAAEVRKGGNPPPRAAAPVHIRPSTPAHIRPSMTPGQQRGYYRCFNWCTNNRDYPELNKCQDQCLNYWTTHKG